LYVVVIGNVAEVAAAANTAVVIVVDFVVDWLPQMNNNKNNSKPAL